MTYLDNVVVMQRIVIDAANGFKIDASAPSVLWSISISNLQREHLQPIVDQALLSVVPDLCHAAIMTYYGQRDMALIQVTVSRLEQRLEYDAIPHSSSYDAC